jgi:hypothetical protein
MHTRVVGRYAVLLSLALAIGACRTATVLQPEISVALVAKLTEAQVADAIRRAGKERGWEMEDAGPGHITGTLRVRGRYLAVTDIAYSPTQIRIAYKDSQNLDYDDGEIHKSYNKWVKRLSDAIRKELARPS